MPAILRRLLQTRRQRSVAFARAHFGPCRIHLREARAVHAALEKMCHRTLASLDPEATIRDLLPLAEPRVKGTRRLRSTDLSGLTVRAVRDLVVELLADESVMKPLLGPAHSATRWDPSTIWARSVRGVINERVRHQQGCTCGVGASRPTTRCS